MPRPRSGGGRVRSRQSAVRSEGLTADFGLRTSLPDWATPITLDDMRSLVRETRRLLPDVGIQIPPNLADWWVDLVEEGATDLGGLSANGDHISPEQAFPSPHQVRKRLAPRGYALTERLCAYPQYLDPEWIEQGVLDVVKLKYWSFIPRRGSGRRSGARSTPSSRRARSSAGGPGEPLSDDELTALFAETRPEVIEEMRVAADALRAELAGDRRDVRGQPQHQLHQRLRGRLRVLRLRAGQAIARRLPRHPRGLPGPDRRRGRVRRHRDLHAGGIHPDYTLEHYGRWLRLAKEAAPQLHLHAYSPMEVHYMCERRAARPRQVFDYLLECGLGSTPGTAAEVLDDGVRARISPNKLPADRWVEIIEACHRVGLRSTSTVMFGHIEEPWELARTCASFASSRSEPGGSPSSCRCRSSRSKRYSGARTGSRRSRAQREPQHTAAFRLALGRTIPNLQASWVKMGLEAARRACAGASTTSAAP